MNISVVPLSVDSAQGDGPQVRTEAGQLGNVVGHLQHDIINKSLVYMKNVLLLSL